MCVLVAEWSEAKVSEPWGANDPGSISWSELILFFFLIIWSVQYIDKAVVNCLFSRIESYILIRYKIDRIRYKYS